MRRFLVPEVLQSSLTDCGPAALMAVFAGFGVAADYEAVRERCGTGAGGTSLDALAALARELGLDAKQVLISRDSFLLPQSDALPAIVVTRRGGGLLHFDVVWRRLGPLVQVLDPQSGRRWLPARELLAKMPDLPIPISQQRWRAWAGSENALAPLRARLAGIGIRGPAAAELISLAARDPGWRSLAALDAGVRMLATLCRARAVRRGAAAAALLRALTEPAPQGEDPAIPKRFWWTEPGAAPEQLRVRGAVIVHFAVPGLAAAGARAARPVPSPLRLEPESEAEAAQPWEPPSAEQVLPAPLVRELRGAEAAPMRPLWKLLRWDSPRTLAALTGALAASAVITAAEAVLFRGVWQVSAQLVLQYQRAAALAALLVFALCGLLLEAFISGAMRRLGTRLELRLRAALLEKLPRLDDRYLRTRTTWDLASRAHAMHLLRDGPALGAQLARAAFTLCTTAAGIAWVHPHGAPWLAAGVTLALAPPWLLRGLLADALMRLRAQNAALDRLYLDSLLGSTAVRVHGAERAVQREHEDLLVEWSMTARTLHARSSAVQGLSLVATAAATLGLVASYVRSGNELSGLLLLTYWSVRLGAAAQEVTSGLALAHNLRSVALRLLSPLGARTADTEPASVAAPAPARTAGAALELREIEVRAGDRAILSGISAQIPAGAHVAIVGASGAGKSTLFGLLLGWLPPAQGTLLCDDEPLCAGALARLRAQTAWVDPAVALWDRSLYDNATFGADPDALEPLPRAMDLADLSELVDQLPEGLSSPLGEGGSRLSGGQGQRVRLARALLRPQARLVLLDEAFRGLERGRRRELLARARAQWADATLLFASHDVADTEEFDRVLVLEDGRLVEDDCPKLLLERTGSVYRRLVHADRELRPHTWWAPGWRRARLEDGRLTGAALP